MSLEPQVESTASVAVDGATKDASVRPARSLARLRQFARARRGLGFALLLAPALLSLLLDLVRRADRLLALGPAYKATYAAALLESCAVWGMLLYAASRQVGRARWLAAVLFVWLFTFSVGGQTYFFEQYNAYLNVDVSLFASNFMDSVVNQLFADIKNYARAKLLPFAFALGAIWLGRRIVRPRRAPSRIAVFAGPVLLVASFFIPTQHRHLQAATPDALYLHAMGGLVRTQLGLTEQSNQLRPRVRESLPVPALSPGPPAKRNVLLLILESVRSDSACSEFDPECKLTGTSNLLLPERYAFTQMRSVASSTAISLAVLWSGLNATEDRDALHTWPLIFDYARAAGYDTAFWTSQNMMFGNARLWVKNLGVRKFVSATDLDPTSDLDMGAPEQYLARHVNSEIGSLQEPFLAVIQFSNVHYPYYLDENGPQPFQPATTSKAPDENGSFKNYYQNCIYQQDQHVASVIRHLRSTEIGKRTVIMYTSDHGEAFREHGQMGHTFSVFDEEVKVPAWIDAPPGTLDQVEIHSLKAKKDAFLFHIDIAPTILDLMGVLDQPQIARFKERIHGVSMLRPYLPERVVPMTNCAGVWSCAFENWGLMRGRMKLEARAWDPGWKCHDLEADPLENENLALEACGDLQARATQLFRRLPGQNVAKPE